MYCSFYGFREKPFNITPNPRYIFLEKQHQEAFAHLLYGIEHHAGFIELTGEVGTGKTTILRALLEQLDPELHRVALIFNPRLSALELMRSINREFGLSHGDDLGIGQLLDLLYQFLLQENADGHTVTLIIDEAQNLHPYLLEQIRLISNLETATDKLIQIVLAGQPELNTLLAKPELRQLAQRITVRCQLGPLPRESLKAYLDHRLLIASGYRTVDFSDAAIKKIYSFSKGVPRLINIIADRALLVAFNAEKREVTADHVTQALREVRRTEPGFRRFLPLLPFAALGMVIFALALWLLLR